jgi:DNA-directed RNA polymerase subunit RPC12/RpoP
MMGAVAMDERQIGRDRGYPIMEATLYIYCDACGSFHIKTYVPFFKIIITLLLISVVVLIYRQVDDWRWYLALLPLLFFAMYSPWTWRDIYLRYRCRKCGNTDFSVYNTMQYPAYDPTIVDVPDEQTQKRYIDESVPHFHQFL